jgi:hypothetical protein
MNDFHNNNLCDAWFKSCNITPYGGQTDNDIDVAYRIIADHIRMACVCIADGLLPGNKHINLCWLNAQKAVKYESSLNRYGITKWLKIIEN